MTNNSTLYYFTESYPFGLGEQWKTNELVVLKNEFNKILVIPFHFGGNDVTTTDLPTGIEYLQPLFKSHHIKSSLLHFYKLFNINFWYFITELFLSKSFTKRKKIYKWLNISIKIITITKHPIIQNIIKKSSKNDVFYFFWGKGVCEIIPLKLFRGKTIVRMHGFDLYLDRNQGYIPYRQQLLNSADKIILISKNGQEYLKSNFTIDDNKLFINRIGVREVEPCTYSLDNIFRIFSCSSLIPLKRVSLIADALSFLNFNIEWIHIGDGPLMNELQEKIKFLPKNIKVVLTGKILPKDVTNYYSNKKVDLFINVSTTEGVPVTIMEAISAGIPIMATDVGGTNEIVTNKLGVLLPTKINAEQLSNELNLFYNLPLENKKIFRNEALKMFNENYNAEINLKLLVKIINS